MVKGLVSVVLSIYNVEKYLDRCIESVVNQTYPNLEILLIDDGARDRCPEICEEWARKDSRIRVIHKENAGLGMARNTGIENATGEYICFFDSDDYIAPDTIEKAYGCADRNQAEIVIFGMTSVDDSGKYTHSFVPKVGSRVYKGEQVQKEFLPDLIAPDPAGNGERVFYMSAWVMLYSMELIAKTGWRFVSEREIIAEDIYSLLALFRHVSKVAVLPEVLYYYCDNGASLSRRYRPERYKSIRYFYQQSLRLCGELNYSEDIVHRISKPYLAFTLAAMKQEVLAEHIPRGDRMAALRKIIDDDVLQQVLRKNKKDRVSVTRKVMFFAMRMKWYPLCFFLFKTRG